MPDKDLSALFLDTLKDIYYAEKQIEKALPRLRLEATDREPAGVPAGWAEQFDRSRDSGG